MEAYAVGLAWQATRVESGSARRRLRCLRPNKIHRPLQLSARPSTLSSTTTTMDKRTTESPMDFEWQTRAPGDVTSPFYQLSMQHENQKKRE